MVAVTLMHLKVHQFNKSLLEILSKYIYLEARIKYVFGDIIQIILLGVVYLIVIALIKV